MAEAKYTDKQLETARKNMEAIQAFCDKNEWKHTKSYDDGLGITISLKGTEIPIDISFHARPGYDLIIVSSVVPGNYTPDRFAEGTVALNAINYLIAAGAFTMSPRDGRIYFNNTLFYGESVYDPKAIDAVIGSTFTIVDKFIGQLVKLEKGELKIDQFLQKLN